MDDLEADELPVADAARTFEDPSPAHLRMLKGRGFGFCLSGDPFRLVELF